MCELAEFDGNVANACIFDVRHAWQRWRRLRHFNEPG